MAKNKGIAGATLEGVKGSLQKGKIYDESRLRLQHKRCLITGANSGLGKGIAIRMASLGAEVTMAGRTTDTAARDDIIRASGNSNVSMETIDLADFASVGQFCGQIKASNRCFDIVVINAATVAKEGRTTTDGLDLMTQVNFLSNVLLLESLLANGSIASSAPVPSTTLPTDPVPGIPRIVVVSSEAHRWSESIDINALDQPRQFKMKESMKVYSDTKFMMAAYTALLAKRLCSGDKASISVHALCPGAVNSNLAREAPAILRPLLKGIFFLFFASPHKASRPVVHLAGSMDLEGKTALYYHMMKEKQFDARALDESFQQQLFTKVQQILHSKGMALPVARDAAP